MGRCFVKSMKKKVIIIVHQLNIGGVQKALISALNAIDYSKNEVTLYVRKSRTDLMPIVNRNVSRIIINQDQTRYYRKLYSVWLQFKFWVTKNKKYLSRLNNYIVSSQMKYEQRHYFSNNIEYDLAVSYIQSYTAKFVDENVKAKRKVMFYHGSTDEHHEVNAVVMQHFERIYCVSKGAQRAVQGFYPQYAEKIECLENYVDAECVRHKANDFIPDYPQDKLILCSCGRITQVKGFDLALGAAEILKQQGIDFKWYFVGDGADRAKIEILVSEKQLDDCIEITGLKNNPYPYIENCDMYVQPSYEEAYGLTIIEAQILGKVIVSTATIGGKTIIMDGKTGVIAKIEANSIAQKIILLNQNIDLQKTICGNLANIDYSNDYQRFRNDWERVLEG